jgi:hypothetical protein
MQKTKTENTIRLLKAHVMCVWGCGNVCGRLFVVEREALPVCGCVFLKIDFACVWVGDFVVAGERFYSARRQVRHSRRRL